MSDYTNGCRYIVWVGGTDDYYKDYKDAKRDANEWRDKGYDDVIIEEIIKKPSGCFVHRKVQEGD
tara:strand:+ start:316 stop:510 length:195 start_codon:yes stop_codon:yes gene_type:complete